MERAEHSWLAVLAGGVGTSGGPARRAVMGFSGFRALEKTSAAEGLGAEKRAAKTVDAMRRRNGKAEPIPIAALRRPAAPSRRLATAHMAPSTFLWLIGGWMAALAVLAIVAVWLRQSA
jgi:hypothetical protein